MKKLNLLAVVLFFAMTARADNNQAIHEACETKKNQSICLENAVNANDMIHCRNAHKNAKQDLYKKYNYKEVVEYDYDDREGMFSYSITSNPPASSDVAYSFPIQVDPSCNKINPLIKSTMDALSEEEMYEFIETMALHGTIKAAMIIVTKNPNLLSAMKMCLISRNNTMSKLQGCK